MPINHLQARWFRLRRSGLVEPFATAEEAARALVGIQAQFLPAAALALWNRTSGLSNAAVEHKLYESRTLVKLWGQRGTLHLYASQDWPLLSGALASRPDWWERQMNRSRLVPYEAMIARVEEMLRENETLGRKELRAADLGLPPGAFSSWGGVFVTLVRRGYACHARPLGSQGRFVHRSRWLPHLEWDPPSEEEANLEITRRYLRGYGPARDVDLAYWRGAAVGDARRWLAALGTKVAQVTIGGQAMWALPADMEALAGSVPEREAWPVRLLYRFDPLLLGFKDKAWIADPSHYKQVWRIAGHIEGTLLEHGRIAGVWRYSRRGRGLAIDLTAFAPLPAHVQAAVEESALEIARFFDLELADLCVTMDE